MQTTASHCRMRSIRREQRYEELMVVLSLPFSLSRRSDSPAPSLSCQLTSQLQYPSSLLHPESTKPARLSTSPAMDAIEVLPLASLVVVSDFTDCSVPLWLPECIPDEDTAYNLLVDQRISFAQGSLGCLGSCTAVILWLFKHRIFRGLALRIASPTVLVFTNPPW